MKKRLITFLSLMIVVSSFFCVAHESGALFSVNAETQATSSTTTQKPAEEQEYNTTPTSSTSATTESTTQSTTESTTKSDGSKDNSSTRPTIIDWNKLTSTSKKNEEEKSDVPSENNSENPSENEPGTDDPSSTKPSTTKKKSTTKRRTTTVPKMTIPVVDNTQVEGTTLSPLDAYFERISGNSEEDTYMFAELTTDEEEEAEEEKNLSMGAIIAICIGGIALVTCALTGLFVLRNKKAAEEDSDEYEYDDEYEEAEEASEPSANVDNTGSYKVVDYNSDDYK